MRADAVDVFDLDGTLIRVNSFREITKKVILLLFKKFKLKSAFALVGAITLRRMRILSHLAFMKHAVGIFERELTPQEKTCVCQSVFEENVNKNLAEQMFASKNCVISTAAPYQYVSRMSFGKDIAVISALDPHLPLPDAANLGEGKVRNLMACLVGTSPKILLINKDIS